MTAHHFFLIAQVEQYDRPAVAGNDIGSTELWLVAAILVEAVFYNITSAALFWFRILLLVGHAILGEHPQLVSYGRAWLRASSRAG